MADRKLSGEVSVLWVQVAGLLFLFGAEHRARTFCRHTVSSPILRAHCEEVPAPRRDGEYHERDVDAVPGDEARRVLGEKRVRSDDAADCVRVQAAPPSAEAAEVEVKLRTVSERYLRGRADRSPVVASHCRPSISHSGRSMVTGHGTDDSSQTSTARWASPSICPSARCTARRTADWCCRARRAE